MCDATSATWTHTWSASDATHVATRGDTMDPATTAHTSTPTSTATLPHPRPLHHPTPLINTLRPFRARGSVSDTVGAASPHQYRTNPTSTLASITEVPAAVRTSFTSTTTMTSRRARRVRRSGSRGVAMTPTRRRQAEVKRRHRAVTQDPLVGAHVKVVRDEGQADVAQGHEVAVRVQKVGQVTREVGQGHARDRAVAVSRADGRGDCGSRQKWGATGSTRKEARERMTSRRCMRTANKPRNTCANTGEGGAGGASTNDDPTPPSRPAEGGGVLGTVVVRLGFITTTDSILHRIVRTSNSTHSAPT